MKAAVGGRFMSLNEGSTWPTEALEAPRILEILRSACSHLVGDEDESDEEILEVFVQRQMLSHGPLGSRAPACPRACRSGAVVPTTPMRRA